MAGKVNGAGEQDRQKRSEKATREQVIQEEFGQDRYSTHGAENVPPASAPVSRRVAPCAVFGEGVAVVTIGREIRLVGAIWAGVGDLARAA